MQIFDSFKSTINQSLDLFLGHKIVIKREDLIHPRVSGNKFRKLKYIFQEIKEKEVSALLTFGGAFSNHLAATAYAGKNNGVHTIGIVRGDEWERKINESATLNYCVTQGMELHCVSRDIYTQKEQAPIVSKLMNKMLGLRIIPEGGTEPLAVKGCLEILESEDHDFDVICSSVGTGGTLAGLVNSSNYNQNLIGFNALNNTEIVQMLIKAGANKKLADKENRTALDYAKFNKNTQLIILLD